jgi:hypothetical protein
VERFPVFVREEDQHTGSLTPLLGSRTEVEHAALRLRVRGYDTANLLIVEYCDARGSDGLVRKYSAFRVGDSILAKHLMIGSQWMLKSESSVLDEEKVREEQEYLRANPHEAWIREMFELAGIDYGRIDYGYSEGKPQVWEINTDPTIGRHRLPRAERERYRPMRKSDRESFQEQFQAAFRNLDVAGENAAEIPIFLDPALRRKMKAEYERKQIGQAVERCASYIVHSRAMRQIKPLFAHAATAVIPLISRLQRWRVS